jgi:Lar family restriction alleviation protein
MKLLPCPFCGGDATIERYGDRRQSTIYSCDSCGCTLETGEEWDHGREWNERWVNETKEEQKSSGESAASA